MVRNSEYCEVIENLCRKDPFSTLDEKAKIHTWYLLPASAESIYFLSQTGILLTGYLFDKAMCGDLEEERNLLYEKIGVKTKDYQKRATHNRIYPTFHLNEIRINENAQPYKPRPPLKESAKLAAAQDFLAAKLHVHPHRAIISRPDFDVYFDVRQISSSNPNNKMNAYLKKAAMEKGSTEEDVKEYLDNFQKRKGVVVGIFGLIPTKPLELNNLTFIKFLSEEDSKAYKEYTDGVDRE